MSNSLAAENAPAIVQEIIEAIQDGSLEHLTALLEDPRTAHGTGLFTMDDNACNLILSAAFKANNVEAALKVIDKIGPNHYILIDEQTESTPLIWFIANGHEQQALTLINRDDIQLDRTEKNNNTPLLEAIEAKMASVTFSLLKKYEIQSEKIAGLYEDLSLPDSNLDTLNKLYAEKEKNFNLDAQDRINRQTALSHAIEEYFSWPDAKKVITELLRLDARFDLQDWELKTSLHSAAEKGCLDDVIEVIQKDHWQIDSLPSILNMQDENGNTVLHILAEENCVNGLNAALKAGANPHIPNMDGDLPINVVDPTEIKEILKKAMEPTAQRATGLEMDHAG